MIPSATWSPTRNTGLSEVIGSWKIMEIRLPRTARIPLSGSVRRSVPSKRTRPETILPGNGTRRRIDRAVTLLPHPDSPTMARVSAPSRVRLRSFTAVTGPAAVSNCVVRFWMERRGVTEGTPGFSCWCQCRLLYTKCPERANGNESTPLRGSRFSLAARHFCLTARRGFGYKQKSITSHLRRCSSAG